MTAKQWNAKWIAHPDSHIPVTPMPMVEEGERNVYYLFRREFDLSSAAGKAYLNITGSTWYRLYLNGEFVETGPIQSPVYYKYYNRREVGNLLRPGRNVIAVELQMTGKSFQGALLLELEAEDGSCLEGTSGQWKCRHADAWKTDVHFFAPSAYCPWQEIFDARKMPAGWKLPGFDASGWTDAEVYYDCRGGDTPPSVSPWFELKERDIPFLKEERVYPERVSELSEHIHIRSPYRRPEDLSITLSAPGRPPEACRFHGTETLCAAGGVCEISGAGDSRGGEVHDPGILLDFGVIVRACAELSVEGPPGTRIEIGYAEDLIDGHFNNSVGTVFADAFLLAEGVTEFRSFLWKSFRYLKLRISGAPPYSVRIHYVRGVSERYPLPEERSFRSSDRQLSRIFDMSAYTIDLCTADNIFDTPGREQGQWMYDSCGVILNGLLWGFGETAMCRKYLSQTAHALLPTGTFASFSNATSLWWKNYTDCGLHYTRAMWEYYRFSGDDSLIFQYYPQLMLNMDFYRKYVNRDGLIADEPSVFLDWAYNFSGDARRGISAPLNAIYFWMLEFEAEICRLYGDRYRCGRIREQREKLAEAFLPTFWDERRMRLSDAIIDGRRSDAASEYAHALAILSGLLTGERMKAAVEQVFVSPSESVLEAEPFACAFVLKALARADRFDLAMDILRKRWGKRWADKGYTSTPENWALNYYNGEISAQHSHSHAWSAGPCEFLIRELAGLEIVKPGFEAVRFSPRSAEFDCTLKIRTPRGTVTATCTAGKWHAEFPDSIAINEKEKEGEKD